jgi:thymidylate synthase (FAD)
MGTCRDWTEGISLEIKVQSELMGNHQTLAEMTRAPTKYVGCNSHGQWVRHRMFNMNAQSGRYTPFEEDDFYVPSVWRKQSKDNKQASEGEVTNEEGRELTQELIKHYEEGFRLYKKALDTGVSREMARLFLPGFSVYYTWVVKADCHNLMHFLRLRMANDAQYEIRVYAQAIYEHFFKPALPWTAEAFEEYVLNKQE